MSSGVDVYLELRQQELIQPHERGPMPLPEDVADAMEACAITIERHAFAVVDNVMPMAPDELRWLADEIRDGTPAGRLAFRATLLDIVEIKRGNKPSGGVTRFLAVEVLAPFAAPTDLRPNGEVAGEDLDAGLEAIAEISEHADPVQRR